MSMKQPKKSKRGGARPGAGRKPLAPGQVMLPVTVNVLPAQREKLKRLGGAKWLRQQIDDEQEVE